MTRALGQLPNAPLIYVLAQVVFSRVPKMVSLWEDFHQTVFDKYPDGGEHRIRDIQLSAPSGQITSEITQWHMVNREKTEGIILGSDSIVFHVTSYQTSDVFFNKLNDVLKSLADILPKAVEVNRLGLRYIDLLLPEKGLSVEEQVSGKLGSISLKDAGCEFHNLEEVTRYKTHIGGDLVIRHRQSTKRDVLPGDLFPNNLAPASRFAHEVEQDTVVGLLDFDHYVQTKIDFSSESIIGKMRSMHQVSSEAFKLTTTSEAKTLWKGVK